MNFPNLDNYFIIKLFINQFMDSSNLINLDNIISQLNPPIPNYFIKEEFIN